MGKKRPKILFLSAHIQPFLLAGIQRLLTNDEANIIVVSWPSPGITPLQLPAQHPNLTFLVKDKGNIAGIEAIIERFDADVVFAAGWMDKDYLNWGAGLKSKGRPVIMGIDNQWNGSMKQRLNCGFASLYLHKSYTHAWVPGYLQYEYARRLGFEPARILKGLYSAIVHSYFAAYDKFASSKAANYPHTFLYAGRLVEHKFGKLLRAFASLDKGKTNGWKLIVAGDGPLKEHAAFKDPDIDYRGFLQPGQLAEIAGEAGVFCLTSDVEPWGTVIEEFAHAGLPLMLSANCGAAYSFLTDGYNGTLLKQNTINEIQERMQWFIDLPDSELEEMGKRSHMLAHPDTPGVWAATLISVLRQ